MNHKVAIGKAIFAECVKQNMSISETKKYLNKVGVEIEVVPAINPAVKPLASREIELPAMSKKEVLDLFSVPPKVIARPKADDDGTRKFKRWTPSEVLQVEELLSGGLSDGEIAEKMGRTVKAIKHRRLQVDRRCTRTGEPWTEKEILELAKMLKDGATYAEIGAKLKRSTGSISGQVHVHRSLKDPRF